MERESNARHLAIVASAALAATTVMAWPVLLDPTTRLFGAEIAGRYRDPFVVAHQWAVGQVPPPFLQPVTDLPGIWIARIAGGVAACNLVVLLSFPLAAAAMYALAWWLTGSRLASGVAAAAYAWSPFHVAHAAYHPHIAQVEWWPLYVLALCIAATRPSFRSVVAVVMAGLVLSLSSFYWALVAGVVTPPVLVAAGLTVPAPGREDDRRVRLAAPLLAVTAALLFAAALAVATLFPIAPERAFPAADLRHYGARWASYVLPPIDAALTGDWARQVWTARGVGPGLVEQQVGSGWGLLGLAIAAVVARALKRSDQVRAVPFACALAVIAVFCSLAPGSELGPLVLPSPSSALHAVLPMFRAYARFGVLATLGVALLAGIGTHVLWRTRGGRPLAFLLLALAVTEVRPLHPRWRDVLPEGYRWVSARGGEWRVLDCTPPGREYGPSISVVAGARATFREAPFEDCGDPTLGERLAAHAYSHVLMRRGSPEGRWVAAGGRVRGLSLEAELTDELVFAVTAAPAAIYTGAFIGFHDREYSAGGTWRWMPSRAEWLVTNRTGRAVPARLTLDASALGGPRTLELWLKGARVARASISAPARVDLGPFWLPPGESRLAFVVPEGDVVAADVLPNGDTRRLAIRVDDWRWTIDGTGAAR